MYLLILVCRLTGDCSGVAFRTDCALCRRANLHATRRVASRGVHFSVVLAPMLTQRGFLPYLLRSCLCCNVFCLGAPSAYINASFLGCSRKVSIKNTAHFLTRKSSFSPKYVQLLEPHTTGTPELCRQFAGINRHCHDGTDQSCFVILIKWVF